MKVSTKGQVTIPRHIRSFLGVFAHSEVDFEIRDGEVILRKVAAENDTAGGARLRKLRGLKKGKWTSEEWLTATRGD